MSVDILSDNPNYPYQSQPENGKSLERVLKRYPLHGPATDTLLMFGGFGGQFGSFSGERGSPTDGGVAYPGAFDKYLEDPNDSTFGGLTWVIASLQRRSRPRPVAVRVFSGALFKTKGVEDPLWFIRRNFDPRGRVVIYGYSAGGLSAMRLTREIQSRIPCFDFSNRTFRDRIPSTSPDIGLVRVDCLVTVDAASGPTSYRIDRSIPKCVRLNHNYWQKFPQPGAKSRGGDNKAVDPNTTSVESHPKSSEYEENPNSGHVEIDELTADEAADNIATALGWRAESELLRVPGLVPAIGGDVVRIFPGNPAKTTLAGIAKAKYGSWQLWPLIYDRNKATIGPNPNTPKPGVLIVLSLSAYSREKIEDARQRASTWKNKI